MSSWRQSFPSVAAGEDFVYQHPMVFIGYSIALVMVYLLVIVPFFHMLMGHQVSGFQNLLYTGPGGSLGATLGSCRSDRNQCGTAEPFTNDYGMAQRHLTERSRFLADRTPDAVFQLGQDDADAMQAEIAAITGDDNEAAVTVGLAQANTMAAPMAAPAAIAVPASRFSTMVHVSHAEDALGAIAQGYA